MCVVYCVLCAVRCVRSLRCGVGYVLCAVCYTKSTVPLLLFFIYCTLLHATRYRGGTQQGTVAHATRCSWEHLLVYPLVASYLLQIPAWHCVPSHLLRSPLHIHLLLQICCKSPALLSPHMCCPSPHMRSCRFILTRILHAIR